MVQVAEYGSLAILLPVSSFVGYAIGYLLDKAFGTHFLYFVFLILGGIWFPLSGALQNIGKGTPTYEAVKISTDVIGNASVPAYLVIGLIAWLAFLAGLAILSVRSMAETV